MLKFLTCSLLFSISLSGMVSVTSPIYQLPPEITAKILHFVMQSQEIPVEFINSEEAKVYIQAQSARKFLITCKHFYKSEQLTKALIDKTMRLESTHKTRCYIFTSMYLNTFISHLLLSDKILEPKYIAAAGCILRSLCRPNIFRSASILPTSKKTIQKLLDNGVPVNITGKKRVTALMYVVRGETYDSSHSSKEIKSLLLQRGANPNLCDAQGRNLKFYQDMQSF